MTPKEYLNKIESLNISDEVKSSIRERLSKETITREDVLAVQDILAKSLDEDFKELGAEVDIENDPELKEAYNKLEEETEDAENELAENMASVQATTEYLEEAADELGTTIEEIRQEEIKDEVASDS